MSRRDNARYIYGRLVKAGIPSHVAIGILGNWDWESGLKPAQWSKVRGEKSFGLMQWNKKAGRLDNLKRFVGGDLRNATLDKQIDFFLHEIRNDPYESRQWKSVLQARNAEEATRLFERHMERASAPKMAGRFRRTSQMQSMLAGHGPAQAAYNPPDTQTSTRSAGRIIGDTHGLNKTTLGRLNRLAEIYGKPIHLRSGYRSRSRNAAVGGAKASQHIHGNAADISLKGLSDADRTHMVRAARQVGFTRVGAYSGNTGLHLDNAAHSTKGYGGVHPMFDKSIKNMGRAPSWFTAGLQGDVPSTGAPNTNAPGATQAASVPNWMVQRASIATNDSKPSYFNLPAPDLVDPKMAQMNGQWLPAQRGTTMLDGAVGAKAAQMQSQAGDWMRDKMASLLRGGDSAPAPPANVSGASTASTAAPQGGNVQQTSLVPGDASPAATIRAMGVVPGMEWVSRGANAARDLYDRATQPGGDEITTAGLPEYEATGNDTAIGSDHSQIRSDLLAGEKVHHESARDALGWDEYAKLRRMRDSTDMPMTPDPAFPNKLADDPVYQPPAPMTPQAPVNQVQLQQPEVPPGSPYRQPGQTDTAHLDALSGALTRSPYADGDLPESPLDTAGTGYQQGAIEAPPTTSTSPTSAGSSNAASSGPQMYASQFFDPGYDEGPVRGRWQTYRTPFPTQRSIMANLLAGIG